MGELAAAALATAARDYRTLCDSTSLSAYAFQRLMPARTVIVFSAGPAWVSGSGSRQQAHWEGHAAFIDDLTERGLLVAGGPFRRRVRSDEHPERFAGARRRRAAVRDRSVPGKWHLRAGAGRAVAGLRRPVGVHGGVEHGRGASRRVRVRPLTDELFARCEVDSRGAQTSLRRVHEFSTLRHTRNQPFEARRRRPKIVLGLNQTEVSIMTAQRPEKNQP